jgi:hypothetical protein
MNQLNDDARLAALLADAKMPEPDPDFADRIIALAAHELRLRRARGRAVGQVGRETIGLLSVIALFVLLARIGPPAGMGDALPASSPAAFGVILLLLLGLVGMGGCSSMVEQKPSKLTTRVRFPSPAPIFASPGAVEKFGARRAQRGGDKSGRAREVAQPR